jgi:hypothetical protein
MNRIFVFISLFLLSFNAHAQSADALMTALRAKANTIKKYEAKAKLKTDVAFLKIPIAEVFISYAYPDKFDIKRQNGISLLPKGGLKMNLSSILEEGKFMSIISGRISFKGRDLAIVKMLPINEDPEIALATLYVDEKSLLIIKAINTTKDNGTYEVEMEYGKYAKWSLPDKVTMSFNMKDYKLPKAITFEYESGFENKPTSVKPKTNKGKVEVVYQEYKF